MSPPVTSLPLRKVLPLAASLLLYAATVPAAPEPPREVRDLYYGEVLYQFFQQNYYSAAVDLLTARQRDRLRHHDQDAQLLLGGLYLSYGLHDEAEKIFTALLDAGVAPAVHDRAWFYLGKIRYYKELYEEADAALQHVGSALDPALREEFQTLRANLLMAREQYPQAVQALSALAKDGRKGGGHFARFNLGVALLRAGREEEGVALLAGVGQLSDTDPDLKALRDRANLALGYRVIGKNPNQAYDYLRRVRLNGPFSNQALLGMGWVELQRGHPQKALLPWNELAGREPVEAAVFEALLARGHALELLRAYPQAMTAYAEAVGVYERELRTLDATREAVRGGRLWRDLLAQVDGNEMGWFWEAELLPDTPEARYLPTLMASHGFHEAIKNLRDLNFLAAKLARWTQDMPAYDHMLSLRRETYEAQLHRLTPEDTLAHIEDVRASRDYYANELKRIDADHDALALATEAERQLMRRLTRVEERLWRLADQPRIDSARDRYRFYKGLLEYDIRTSYAARRWKLEKALRSLDRAFAETLAQQDSLQRARAEAPRRFEGFDRRIQSLRGRIGTTRQAVQAAFAEQQHYLQALADGELDRLRAQLVDYLDQARFSLAHLQDLAASQGDAGRGEGDE